MLANKRRVCIATVSSIGRMSSVAPEGEVQIKARKKHESTLELPPGSGIHWEFRLHSKDIGFSARFEREQETGQVEEEQVRLPYTL